MLLLPILIWGAASNILDDLSSIYEYHRNEVQADLLQFPLKALDRILGIPNPDEELDLHDSAPPPIKSSRILQTSPPAPGGKNATQRTVDEYLKQGPLIPPDCSKWGKVILLNVTKHYCYKQQVSYVQFVQLSKEHPKDCTIKYRLHWGCHCPPDFYGNQCNVWNNIVCDMEQTQQTCEQPNKFYYNTNFDGDPPCNDAQNGTVYTLGMRAICYNVEQGEKLNVSVTSTHDNYTVIWSNYSKGIHGLMPQNYNYESEEYLTNPYFYQSFTGMDEFTERIFYKYSYNQSEDLYLNLNILKSSHKFEVKPVVTLVDYKSIGSSKTEQVMIPLTLPQLTGSQTFFVQAQPARIQPLFGRYYVEVYLRVDLYINKTEMEKNSSATGNESQGVDVRNFIASTKPRLFFFEDPTYKEPRKTKGLSRGLVFLIIAIVVLVVGLCSYITFRYRKKIMRAVYPQTQ